MRRAIIKKTHNTSLYRRGKDNGRGSEHMSGWKWEGLAKLGKARIFKSYIITLFIPPLRFLLRVNGRGGEQTYIGVGMGGIRGIG